MTYATGRTFYDADSHIMELPDFLTAYADPDMRDRLPEISFAAGGRSSNGWERYAETKAHDPARVAELVAMGDQLIAGPKGYAALGAFNARERSKALDLLGFAKQLVFATFAEGVAFYENNPADIRYAAVRAHNRAMSDFCADDKRLMGVGLLLLDDPAQSLAEIDHLLKLGLKAAWIPHRTASGRAPGHDALDPVWARLAETNIPFVLHVGGVPLQIGKAWMNTGRPVPADWLGGGENVRGKDMTSLHHAVETFIGTMVLDGVFERHRNLRGGVIELGAGYVPSMMRRLDWIAEIWRKSEPDLAKLSRRPSQQLIEQMAFTPYPYEDVGALIRESDASLYLFSSDYPHVEGGRNPLQRFGTTIETCEEAVKDRFYAGNFAKVFSPAA